MSNLAYFSDDDDDDSGDESNRDESDDDDGGEQSETHDDVTLIDEQLERRLGSAVSLGATSAMVGAAGNRMLQVRVLNYSI